MTHFIFSRAHGFQNVAPALVAILLILQTAPAAQAAEPRLSYDPPAPGCPPPPPALEKVELPGYYEDRDLWGIKVKPLYSYLESLSRITDAYARMSPPSLDAASCGLNWLHAWGSGHALSGHVSGRQSIVARKWASGSIALSYLKIRDQTGLDEKKKMAVEKWIGDLAGLVKDSSTGEMSRKNNHAYWNGLANMANGMVLQRQNLFESAFAAYRIFLTQIREDGALPLELARKEHALHYHNFALTPLVFIAELAFRRGIDMYGGAGNSSGKSPIQRLANLVIRSLEDPLYFGKFSPVSQAIRKGSVSNYIGDSDLVWMEPYYARFKDSRLIPFICRTRPLMNWRTGGDATLKWGAKELRCYGDGYK